MTVAICIIVPGPAAEVSVGIAIAHYRHPLQAIVREAQAAEKRAKNEDIYNRAAFALSLLKRGGETVHWGAKWNWAALELYDRYCELRRAETISSRFPYALAGLLAPDIQAELVAARLDKAVTVSGGRLDKDADAAGGGTKPTRLLVSAGSVYYFKCDSEKDAQALVGTLHGQVKSYLLGEQGFGLGVCSAWKE